MATAAALKSAVRRNDRIVQIGCALVIAFSLAELLTYGYGRDQGIYAMVARAILAGKMPYRDAWDFKPPGVFVVFALTRALFGSSQFAIRLVEAAGLVGMSAAMVKLARIYWDARRAGWMAAAIAVLVHAQLDFWHTAQPESFGGMVTIFALLAVGTSLREPSPRSRQHLRRWLFAGALFGFAGLLKPPLAGGGAVVAAALALRCRARGASYGDAARPAIAITIGGAIPFVLTAIWFGAKGALGDLWQVLFVFTPHYTALSWVGETVPGMLYWGFTEWLVTYSSLPTVGVLLYLAGRRRDEDQQPAIVVFAIIVVHIVGIAMQGKFFPYHYGATWPLTAMLAGLGFERVYAFATARAGLVGAAAFVVMVGMVALFRTATKDVPGSFRERCLQRAHLFLARPRDQAAIDTLASVADVNAGANRAVAGWLDAHTRRDQKVFVWGFEPVIYDLADRDPATRFIYDVPQRVAWAKEATRATLMNDLARTPAAAIVVEHRDVFPMVTGETIDSADTLQEFGALRGLLAERYTLVESIEDFDLYLARE